MEQSLAYVREIIAGHTETSEIGNNIYEKVTNGNYSNDVQFVRELSEDETSYLNRVLQDAIEYSKQSQDIERANQLSEVYGLLFV